jgi:hypothetical protein
MSEAPPNDSLAAMSEVLGDEATREIVRLFLKEFPETYRGISTGTPEEQHRTVHGLKSSALHMGALRLSERMALIENRLATEGSVSDDDMASILREFDAAAPSLRRYAGV